MCIFIYWKGGFRILSSNLRGFVDRENIISRIIVMCRIIHRISRYPRVCTLEHYQRIFRIFSYLCGIIR